ncbi:auxin transport protein BIG isoform X3 [Physcomitrium patens]|uniref:auxin transport protein BIG isoform X3 n=1 Tax=Physcomitrium patens TaxID=3218 RepID=UPI000D178AA1|nr:auxin transport protein BIG-like isoform X3 [Physcomitrium patens]|eukprot:XP_024381357.1 auxin transport protein BIG-like isoform X3 [Physcomitrella patens]
MGTLRKLVEVLQLPGGSFQERVKDAEVQAGLAELQALLMRGVDVDVQGAGLWQWNKQQVDFALAIVEAVLCTSWDWIADGEDKAILEQIYRSAVQICLQGLEYFVSELCEGSHSAGPGETDAFKLSRTDASVYPKMQHRLLELLEIAIIEGNAGERSSHILQSLDNATAEVPFFDSPVPSSSGKSSTGVMGRTFGEESHFGLPKVAGPSQTILSLLATEDLFVHELSRGSQGEHLQMVLKSGSSMVAAARQFAVEQIRCIPRLLEVCQASLVGCGKVSKDEGNRLLQGRIALVSSIANFLLNLSRGHVAGFLDEEVGTKLVEFASTLLVFLQHIYESSSSVPEIMLDSNQGSSLPSLLDSLLRLSEVIFPDRIVLQNFKCFVAASMLNTLDTSLKQHGPLFEQQLSLAHTSHVISHFLGLIQDIHAHAHGIFHLQPTAPAVGLTRGQTERFTQNLPSCEIYNKKFDLNQVLSPQEQLQVVFPNEGHWLGNLVALTAFFHAQGLKEGSILGTASSVRSEEESAVGSTESVTVASEDDALFGDLFSESGRHLMNSEGFASTCTSRKKLDALHSTPLQVANLLLSFLKNCLFCSEWHQPTFDVSCKMLSKENLDVFLQIYLSQSSLMNSDALGFDVVDSEDIASDLLGQLHERSFDLLNTLVIRHALNDALELHLATQILRGGDAFSALSAKSCSLFGKLLVKRSIRRGTSTQNDPLAFDFWKTFLDYVLSALSGRSGELNIKKALPSFFQMELLFMAFHSLDGPGRSIILQNLLVALKLLRNTERHPSPGRPFLMWSLLVSRLLLALRYLVLHFDSFPEWLLVHLRRKLLVNFLDTSSNASGDDHPQQSWAGLVAHNIFKEYGSKEERVMDDIFIQQLVDINGSLNNSALQDIDLDMNDICQVISDILGMWKGRSFKIVEELVVERHVYVMGWSTICCLSPSLKPDAAGEFNVDYVKSDLLLSLTKTLLRPGVSDTSLVAHQWAGFLTRNLSAVRTLLCEGQFKLLSWDLLRQGSALTVLLSLLRVGETVTVERNVLEDMSLKKTQLPAFIKQTMDFLSKDDHSRNLLQILSVLLNCYVNLVRDSVSHILVELRSCKASIFSIDVLLQGGLSRSKQEGLLGAMGVNVTILHSLVKWDAESAWLSEHLTLSLGPNMEKLKGLEAIMLPALYHGFPSFSKVGSAALLSAIMCIVAVLDSFQVLLHARDGNGVFDGEVLQEEVLDGLLNTLLVMKIDSTFGSMQSKCAVLLDLLIPLKEEQALYSDLNELKHAQKLLQLLCKRRDEVDETVWEALVLHVLDVHNNIYSDPSRLEALLLYYSKLQPACVEGKKVKILRKCKSLVGSGDISLLIDILDNCTIESVNVKSLQLLVVLLGYDLRSKMDLEQKLLQMDTVSLAGWLEQRFFGWISDADEDKSVKRTAPSGVRDLISSFVQSLVPISPEGQGHRLHSHLLTAMLMNLERAFVTLDVVAAKSYFGLIVQLAQGDLSLKRLLRTVVELVRKLPVNDSHLEGVKSMVSFLNSILSICGGNRMELFAEHGVNNDSFSGLSSNAKMKQSVYHKNLELPPTSQEPGAGAGDCDAMSVDEDEDDATSDGEIASLDRDDDDNGSNSERALASSVCTFTSSGSNFMEQHWYFCYTCDLTVSKGCCSVCARVCHKGHKVVYSRLSRFFCDCGAGSVRGSTCLCLKPRKYVSSSNAIPSTGTSATESFLPLGTHTSQLPLSDSDSDIEVAHVAGEVAFKVSIVEGEEKRLLTLLSELDVEEQVLSLCKRLLGDLNLGHSSTRNDDQKPCLSKDVNLNLKTDLLHLKRAYKSGSMDMKIKTEYPNARELKSHLASGLLVKSLLSISSRGRLAAGEGDKVTVFDVGQLIGQPTALPVTVDKATVKPLSKNVVRFEVVQLSFNTANESYLAVAGYDDCQVFTVNPRGEVTDRLAVELALQDAYIRRIAWVPGSQVELMVVTDKFVKIYDLSQDKFSPTHYFMVLEDSIADACLVSTGQRQLIAIVLSQQGILYRQQVTGCDAGARILTENIQIPRGHKLLKGISLHYSAALNLLFLSYSDNLTLIAHMNSGFTSLSEVASVVEEQDGKIRASGLHYWKELFEGNGLFVCLSSQRSNTAVAVKLGASETFSQLLKTIGNSSSSRVDGVASYCPISKERNSVLLLHDDGSLQVFSYVSVSRATGNGLLGTDSQKQAGSLEPEQVKKLGTALLDSRANHDGAAPVFPLDFFEKTTCITADVKLGGDILLNNDSDGVKLCLQTEDGFLEGPNASGFKILVLNSNPDLVMVGCRVHVGNTSASHIPSELSVFQRSIRLEESVRCWYDIPFSNAEALLADEEFTLVIGPAFGGSSLPRIDSLEIYGRSKDEFGWKEKLEAALDLESPGQVGSALIQSSANRTKQKLMQNASPTEQLLSDSLLLLQSYYLACRVQFKAEFAPNRHEESRKLCMSVLDVVFENDRQPLLQSSARHVLRALYPGKDAYNQAKDYMRLSAVTRSCPLLLSRLAVGGSATSWAVQEFSVQMRAVCKIAVHRQTNLASFLAQHGASVVEDLEKILWEILTREQLDAQSINNLVIPMVDIIYGYAECLSLQQVHDNGNPQKTVAPAVYFLRKLLFAPYEPVRTSCSLAMSARLLQVPLPKQTMLAMDDVAEHQKPPSIPPEVGGDNAGAGQGTMDEDASTASVQYCCDGCSTVPILRRRWHCNVCPDFDLCESCYEVMDADQLPPPHSREHSMSAIAIEMDVDSGEGNELQFSATDEMSDESLLQMATELSLQASAVPLMVPNDSSDVTQSVLVEEPKSMEISASKSAVNSLLLQQLITDIKGWMHSSSGAQAVPVMQLFYRLASAPSGPLVDRSSNGGDLDLELFIKLMLQELDLSRPLQVKSRSNLGEVRILVFMFFTFVLRNWHQPGSEQTRPSSTSSSLTSPASRPHETQLESKGSSQSVRACAALRQQPLLNYLHNIILQLMQLLKASSRGVEECPSSTTTAACGALLTLRREFASGSFTPFFSDSYAKVHRGDLFGDYHRLLVESAFKLTYSLVHTEKPEKVGDKDQPVCRSLSSPDWKLEEWQEVLCSYVNNPQTAFIRKYARRLLLHLCGTKSHYYSVKDAWQLSREVKRLYKLSQKTDGFQTPLPYEMSVKLVKCLSIIVEVAQARPWNWQKHCSRHIDVVQFLLKGVFSFGEESVVQTLKLLMLVFYTGKEGGGSGKLSSEQAEVSSCNVPALTQAGTSTLEGKKKKRSSGDDTSGHDNIHMDMDMAVEQFSLEEGKVLKNFIDMFLLEWNSTSVRFEAKAVLHGTWNYGKQSFRVLLLKCLLEKIPVLPSYGHNIVEYTDLFTWLLAKGDPHHDSKSNSEEASAVRSCLTGDVVKHIFGALCAQNELLANHPNSRIYNTLTSLVEFDGYYLESEPCLACSSPEVPHTRMKLDSLKAETKFTDNRILVKCVGSHTIQSVMMNVHDARRSKSIKTLNLYYNNRAVADLSELKNNWSLWKRARSCHLAFNQTELKVEFLIPIIACNLMIELDTFYENIQAASLESLQCPRCSRHVTDKHGICGNCHENAYQCRQCRNINYENLDSFLCNECGYSKYGRFEFNFMAKPSFTFDHMENDEDMKKGLAAIESESENAHRKYQQLLGFKKPLLKLVSSIGETETDSQQKESVQQMLVSLPGPSSYKISRKVAILGVLYAEKCKMAFDSVSKSVQTLQGLRRVLMTYLERKRLSNSSPDLMAPRPTNKCFGCANTFVGQCLEWLQVLSKQSNIREQLVSAGIVRELFENNIHQGPKAARIQARAALCAFSEGNSAALQELNQLIKEKTLYCVDHHRSMDISSCVRDELQLLSETCSLTDEFWEARLRIVFQILFRSIQVGAHHPMIADHIILPCLRVVVQACTPPRLESSPGHDTVTAVLSVSRTRSTEESAKLGHSGTNGTKKLNPSGLMEKKSNQDLEDHDISLVNYAEWRNGATYLDFSRRQSMISQAPESVVRRKPRKDSKHGDYLALKYSLMWRRKACRVSVIDELAAFEESSWVQEIVLSACSQALRLEMCRLIEVLCAQSPVRRSRFLNLLMNLLPATCAAGESAADYFELLFKMVEPEDSRLYLTVRGFLHTTSALISDEVSRIEAQERSSHTDISQGYILHKLIELLSKFLQLPNIRIKFMKEQLLARILEALLAVKGLVVQKTKLIGDCERLMRELLDSLLQESYENKRHFIRACVSGLSRDRNGRSPVFILEQLCNIICPTKPEPAYMMVLNKAHTQEEFIRGSMTKNPYSSLEIGPLMRDVKNKICRQLELLGLIEDDYGMELLVAGRIIALDLSVAQVYEQVWKKAHSQAASSAAVSSLQSTTTTPGRECPPMTVTYRLQGLDGEAIEPMIKELEDDREEVQDPEVEFAIAGVMQECGGLEIVVNKQLSNAGIKSGQEELTLVLKLLMYCCKLRANRQALLHFGALAVLLETARRAFSTDAVEPAEGLLLIIESLVSEANESDVSVELNTGGQAAAAVEMFLDRLTHSSGAKQQRNNDTVARILPFLTYGEQTAMEVLVNHFLPSLMDWDSFDSLQKLYCENTKNDRVMQKATEHQRALANFVRVTESIKRNSNGERLKSLVFEKGIISAAIQYLKRAFPVQEKGLDQKATPEWVQALEMPSVPIILSMLRGLSRGHLVTQQYLDNEGILPLLHGLEGVPGENEIGARAENLMDTLADKEGINEGFLSEKIVQLRNSTRDEMRRRALRRRQELLEDLGMRREIRLDGGERIVVSKPHIEGMDEVEEEEAGLACMVCREGYLLRPTDMLGTYCYSKRVNVGMGVSSHKRSEWIYTTVSHFNVIHFQCHQEAKRADASLKNPKKEWEGATLRNSETLCNNIFPLRGPSVLLAQYARCVDQYWDSLNSLGRADGSRLRLLIFDIVMMLGRFATNMSFSVDCKGGGRESNSRLLPFMIQMARHLLDQGGAGQRRIQAKSLATYLSPTSSSESVEGGSDLKPGTPTTPQRGSNSEENVQFMMVQSLLVQSIDEWQRFRRTFIRRGLAHAYVMFKQGRSLLPAPPLPSPLTALDSSPLQSPSVELKTPNSSQQDASKNGALSTEQLFIIAHPMLVYVGLVDQLQHLFKSGSIKAQESEVHTAENTKEATASQIGVEPWEVTMKERTRDVGAMLGFSKEILEWLEEMHGAGDVQEAFDIMGALSDALTGGCTSCDDFVRDAISGR